MRAIVSLAWMVGRLFFVATCVVLLVLATTRRAEAQRSVRPAIWKPAPPPIDTTRTRPMLDLFERFARACRRVPFAMHERAMRERGGEAIGRELATSLGVPSPSVSPIGASAAATGLAAWALTSRDGRTISIAPRLYGGGGGLGFVFRW
jgi:hypothetical protein